MEDKQVTMQNNEQQSQDTMKCSFEKLTPTVDADISVYEEALDYVFEPENKDIQNVAITGVFGSGKSSVINTYEKTHNKKFIHISLAHFKETSTQDSEDIIEKKIINQLIQQVPEGLIPETSFKIKKDTKWYYFIASALCIAALAVLVISIIKYTSLFSYNNDTNKDFFHTFFTPSSTVIFIVTGSLFSFLIVQFVRWQKKNHYIRKIGFKEHTIEFDDYKKDTSFFNRHIDEILYVLERITCTSNRSDGFDGIVIEDLDRFKDNIDAKIFEKLRELCTLGNYRIKKNNETSYCPLRFIYLIRDDVFQSKERTKFFDFIIPIIPFVDSSNAYAKLKGCLQIINYYDILDDHFLHGLSLYFDDYRIIINIVNEFQIYAGKLNNTEHDYNELLAIIVYKNYFPKDFADLQLNSGYVYMLFNKRESMIDLEEQQIVKDIKELENLLIAAENEMLADELELQAVSAHRRSNDSVYKDFKYDDWNKEEFTKRKAAIKIKTEKKEERIRNKIIDKQTQLVYLKNKKLSKFALIYGDDFYTIDNLKNKKEGDDNYSDKEKSLLKVQNDKYFDIIKFLIQSGYFDVDSYRDYMACFDERGMSVSDKNFLIGINSGKGKSFDYKLDNIPLVSEYLKSSSYLMPATRNNCLIDYLLSNNECESLKSFIIQLKDNGDMTFISQFLRNTNCYDLFVEFLCKEWDGFLDYVISEENIDMLVAEKQSMVLTALRVCSQDVIIRQNMSNTLTLYLSEDIRGVSCDIKASNVIANQMDILGVKIKHLDTQISSSSIRKLLISNATYEVNFDNLKSILLTELNYLQDDIDNRFLSSLIECQSYSVSNYVKENLEKAVQAVNDNLFIQNDSLDIISMIMASDIDEELKTGYLELSKTVFEDINDVSEKYWPILAEKHTFSEIESNVLNYFKKYGIDESLILFLNMSQIGDRLVFSKSTEGIATFWEEIYKTDELSDDVYSAIAEEIGFVIAGFNTNSINNNKCKTLLDNRLISMNAISLNTFRDYYPELLKQFIITNIDDYLVLVKGPIFNIKEIGSLLEVDEITKEQKLQLLNMSSEAVSVRNKQLSDEIFEEILLKHFCIDDLDYLLENYDQFNNKCRDVIYKTIVLQKKLLQEVAGICSKTILSKFFEDKEINLTDKAKALDALINNNCPYKVIAELLKTAGEDRVSRLFLQERPRAFAVTNDMGHVQLLEVLKNNGIIKDYYEEDGGAQLRIKKK